jgi:methyl-accepting chemotaxis protein
MNEVVIPIKLAGLGEIKAELKQIKSELYNATDPAEVERLSARAGELNKKLKDINKNIKNFSTGSTVQQVSNQLGGIKDSLMKMDFSKAATQVTTFTATVSKFKVTDLTKGLGKMTKAVAGLSLQFLKMGASLLVNPIFLLVAVITLIVAGVLLFLNKIGVLEKAFNVLMIPIKAVIQLFKDFTDWLGLSSHAADENAAKVTAAAEKSAEASKLRSEQIGKSYDHEIAMAKIAGKDTVKLELEKSVKLQKEAQNRIADNRKAYRSMKHMDDKESIEKRKKLKADIKGR